MEMMEFSYEHCGKINGEIDQIRLDARINRCNFGAAFRRGIATDERLLAGRELPFGGTNLPLR